MVWLSSITRISGLSMKDLGSFVSRWEGFSFLEARPAIVPPGDVPTSVPIARASSSSPTGLATKARAPSSRARRRVAGSARVLETRTGVVARAPDRRSSPSSSNPSMCGISRSVRTIRYDRPRIFRRASTPSNASSTSKPRDRSCRAATRRTLTESSTTSTGSGRATGPRAGADGAGPGPRRSWRASPEGLMTRISSPDTERLVPEITGCPARSGPGGRIISSFGPSIASTWTARRSPSACTRSSLGHEARGRDESPSTSLASISRARCSRTRTVASAPVPSRVSGSNGPASSMHSKGRAKAWPSTRTTIACPSDSLAGKRSVSVVPSPGSEASAIVPRSRPTSCATTSMPTPRPEIALASWRVEKPAWKTRALSRSRLGSSPAPIRPSRRPLAAIAA